MLSADLHVGFTADSIYLLFSSSTRGTRWKGTQPTPATCSEVGLSAIWKTHVRNLRTPSPNKSGPKNHLFTTTSQLNGNFNGLLLLLFIYYAKKAAHSIYTIQYNVFGTKHDVDSRPFFECFGIFFSKVGHTDLIFVCHQDSLVYVCMQD